MRSTRQKAWRAAIGLLLVSVVWVLFQASLGVQRNRQRFALVAAASGGDAAQVKALLSQGADPNAQHLEGSSALWWAVASGNPATVQTLLSSGANPNSRGQYNWVLEEVLECYDRVRGTVGEPDAKAIVKMLASAGVDRASVKDFEHLKLLRSAGN